MAQHNVSINYSTGSDHGLLPFRELMELTWQNDYAELVFIRVLSVIEIPVMILTLIGLWFIIKSRPAASVFVSNLIFSDLIQVICLLIAASTTSSTLYLTAEYYYSLIVGLYFMACVASERYLLVSHPIWYKSHHSLKLSCFISVIVWFVPLIFARCCRCFYYNTLPMSIACSIPYPIIILCFVGTWRGLSRAISLTALQRKLILGSLFLVLLTYTFLILPYVIMVFLPYVNIKSNHYARFLVYVNPLADCLLYMFIRPDVRNMMKSVRCCCRRQSLNHDQDKHSVVNPQNSCTALVCCISAQNPASRSLNTCSSV